MLRLTIDNRPVEVPPGSTILDAARKLDIPIPTLCADHASGNPHPSCMVCVVKVAGHHRLLPACATLAEDGQVVESETEHVRRVRKTNIDLLLSDHPGDCLGPCQHACPLGYDIPLYLGHIAAGDSKFTAQAVRKRIALATIACDLCPGSCEKTCRRSKIDQAVMIKDLLGCALAQETSLPQLAAETGKRIVVVGAGAAGLAAAYHLRLTGHHCTLLEASATLGGRLHAPEITERIDKKLIDQEVAALPALGITVKLNQRLGENVLLGGLLEDYDAVIVAIGKSDLHTARTMGLPVVDDALDVDHRTGVTSTSGLFLCGDLVSPLRWPVRALATGRNVADCVSAYLKGCEPQAHQKPFATRALHLTDEELTAFACGADDAERLPSGALLTAANVTSQAARCLHCECRKQHDCRLREVAAAYGASQSRFTGDRRPLAIRREHAHLIYEPGKCIMCHRCIRITEAAGESLGFTCMGRGFNVKVDVPFDESLEEALTKTAEECIQACPTGALSER